MQLIFNNVGNEIIHVDVLRSICGNIEGKSGIDIGCGFAPQTRQLGFHDILYIDIVKRDLGDENENFIQLDIKELVKTNFPVKTDISICEDVIEHFWEADGKKVIKWMENNSHKQIIFTPLGRYMNVSDETNDDPDTHKFSWLPEMLPDYAHIIFPKYHPTLGEGGLGAFFAFRCAGLEDEFRRVCLELKSKRWVARTSYKIITP